MISLLEKIKLVETGMLPLLVQDYLHQKESLNFLTSYPFDIASFEKIITDKAQTPINRDLLTEVLRSQYTYINTTDWVKKNIELLQSKNTFTVTAAHQPCLFMGPLYNIYKIASTINLAHQLSKNYPSYNFVPVFWLGTEDHDVAELNHTFINGSRIEWSDAGNGASGRWTLASMQKVVESLKQLNAGNELLPIIEYGLKQYETFGHFSHYFVNEIFKEHGLVVLNQDDKRLKECLKPIIADEILNSRAVPLLNETISFLSNNYKAQARPRDINFFYLGEGFRERVVYNNVSQRFEINNRTISFTKEELLKEIETHPERFSPNVIYRPLYQEMILPNLAFVGGAGELSYWLELKPLFAFNKVNFPMLVMRSSAVLLNVGTQKKLSKLNLSTNNFFTESELLISKYIQQQTETDLTLNDERKLLNQLFDSALKKAVAIDSTLAASVGAEKQKTLLALESLEGKILKAEKRKQETTISQIKSIYAWLFPSGSLQERSENFIPYYSPELVSELVNQLNPFEKSLYVFGV